MKPVIDILEEKITAAMIAATDEKSCAAIVRPATDPKFGDYQANGIMTLAKKLKTNPRQLAENVLGNLDISDICEKPEIAGPGFINLKVKSSFVADALLEINSDSSGNFGIEKTANPQRIVVDFSGPNIAKQMHVGHLRSTIIGDCICRLLEFQGHTVIRQNHIGDWGTALGKVILGLWHKCMSEKHGYSYYQNESKELKIHQEDKEQLKSVCKRIRDRHEDDWEKDFKVVRGDANKYFGPFLKKMVQQPPDSLWEEITILYQYVNLLEESTCGMGLTVTTRKKSNGSWEYIQMPYESLSRHITAMLQNIDDKDNEQEKTAWELITEISLEHCYSIYKILNVTLTEEHTKGESFYKDMLTDVVAELKEKGLAVESEGAICVFPPGFKDKEGKPLPLIVQKSDGAFLYATTDLAALRYRVQEIKADRIIYVTDARQALHFQMVFAVARMAGWVSENVELIHVTFGSVLGENGKPLKTREGENVKLKELLDEAVERAKTIVNEKNPDLLPAEKERIAKAVGIGAVKYADYTNNRTSDYIFSFNKMLAMDGNTAPYMQYAYARVQSIDRKAQQRGIDFNAAAINLTQPAELDLAKHLVRYGEAIESAKADFRPNYLTSYLYDLAQKFSVFYTNCPVLNAPDEKRYTRWLLCDLTAKTLKHGLKELLGIEVVEQM